MKNWGSKENRIVVVGTERGKIFSTLQLLGISRSFVYRAVKLSGDTGGIEDSPRSIRTPKTIKSEAMACSTRHPKVKSLKRALNRAVATFSAGAAIDVWPNQLKACISFNSNHFE
ncbi:hypothetical protein ILUMI_20937 [Ignelater luminosus]|uniref:Uncharacterized protein n=1 Tax=Ignelater luminosus TaxID=2038154 RepID=A0A8K0CDE2_IGNLU|nr:hypothetical protein ILUMI_20937 [Ignelater luminosus]